VSSVVRWFSNNRTTEQSTNRTLLRRYALLQGWEARDILGRITNLIQKERNP